VRTWSGLGLGARVGLTAGSVLLVTSLLLIAGLVREDVRRLRANLHAEAKEELSLAVTMIVEPLLVGDYATVEQLLGVRANQPAVVLMAWSGAAGHGVERRNVAAAPAVPRWFARLAAVEDVDVVREVAVGGRTYGLVRMVLSGGTGLEEIWQSTRDRLAIVLVGIGLALGLTLGILVRGLRPFSVLGRAARRFGEGEHAVRVAPDGPPEARSCIEAFNRMGEDIEELLVSLRGAETRLLEVNDALEAKVAERTAALEHAVADLRREIEVRREAERAASDAQATAQAANASKSQFLANMSHEIRTPMNGVLGMAELLLETDLAPDQRRFAQAIHGSGAALLGIVNDILDFSKIEAGKLDFEVVPFDPVALVGEIVDLLATRAGDRGVSLTCAFLDPLPECIVGDPLRVRQILTNLVGNALKFTAHGTVDIRVRRATEADLGPPAPGHADGGIRFEVHDTGIGIAGDVLERLFTVFTQADSTTTRRFGGTGLGLAISRQLAEAMGGRIGVQSEEGRGSMFWFSVPLGPVAVLDVGMAEEARADAQLAILDSPALRTTRTATGSHGMVTGIARRVVGTRRARILVAEDNPVNLQIATSMLTKCGCDWVSAGNGREAVAAWLEAVEQPFDLILMDCQMPELDGFAATAEIRSAEAAGRSADVHGQIAIVALTANAVRGDREQCLAAGMNDYLSKPFSRQQLQATLGRWLVLEPAEPAGH